MGDTSAAAAIPTKRRTARRSAQSLHTHIASRWDQTGSSPRTKKTNTFCKNAAPGARRARAGLVEQTLVCSLLSETPSSFLLSLPRLRATLQQPQQIRGHGHKRRFGQRALRMNHDIPSRGYLSPVAAHDFAQAPPDTIAHHRAAQRLFDADATPPFRQCIGAKEHCEEGTRAALSGAVDRIIFAAPHQPRLAWERQPLFARVAGHSRASCANRG